MNKLQELAEVLIVCRWPDYALSSIEENGRMIISPEMMDWGRKAATEALGVLREPTEPMLDKGEYVNSEYLNDNAPLGQRRYRSPARAVWQAMIDQMLAS